MTDEINNPSHEGRWHEALGRKLTEHELDIEDLTEWQESQTTQKWVVWESGTRFWDGDGAPPGISWEDYANAQIERNAGVARMGTRGSFRSEEEKRDD